MGLSIGKLTGEREDYYLACLAAGEDEYYLAPGERPGYWLGSAAAALDLAGRVEAEQFVALLAGRDPRTGAALMRGAGHPRRVPGFDLTVSAPKSVSLAWAFAPPEVAERITAAHDRAVAATIRAFETEALRARRGRGGLTQVETDGIAAAAFAHRTSRAGDPQLHTHVVVANVTVDGTGRWSAPDGRRIYGWAKTLGYLYEAHLRHELTATLGVRWGPVRQGIADIAGIDPATLAAFSQRRTQILAELQRLGYHSPAAARVATLATRPPKEPAASLEELRARWAQRAATLEVAIPDMSRLVGRVAPTGPDSGAVIEELVGPGGLTRNRSSFDRRDTLQALAAAHPQGASIGEVRAGADRLARHPEVVALAATTPVGGPRWSTADLLAVEARVVDGPRRRAGEHLAVVPVATLSRALAERPSLSAEQRGMIARLTLSGQGLEVVVGRAGAGKTFALDAARTAWQNSGHPVIGTALAARAAAELESGAGIPSTTLDGLLIDVERPGPRGGFAAGTVVVVDEAGMIGSRKLARLLDVAERDRAKVVLVGDPRQLPEIEAGGAFAALCQQDNAVHLVDNRRQAQRWERDALDQLRAGSVATAVAAYHQHGRINAAATADGARQALVDDWWTARQHGSVAAMYALRRSDVEDLNARARHHLRAAGRLGDEAITVGSRELAVGDEILCLRNDRRLQVRNGTTATITAVDPATGSITIAAPDGDEATRRVLPGDYVAAGHVTHAYATTIHKAQGATVDRAFLLGSDALYREAGYVGLSRARQSSDVYLVGPHPSRSRHPSIAGPLDPTIDLARRLQESRAQHLALDDAHRGPDRGLGSDVGLGL